jgi:hypothetical protein
MARSQSVFLTAAVAMVLGIVIGVVGLLALVPKLSPAAVDVVQVDEQTKPQVYGNR